MLYIQWRQNIFGCPAGSDPVLVEIPDETFALPKGIALDYIDQCLVDPDIPGLFTKEQIGIGLQQIYNNSCSDMPFCYLQAGDESRRVESIRRIRYLYQNYFETYCVAPVARVGFNLEDGVIGNLCYMLWDIFVLHPGNASRPMIDAAIGVMQAALSSKNDNCIVSAIHGLGHWVARQPSTAQVLETWLQRPTTRNAAILDYARQATSGCIQ